MSKTGNIRLYNKQGNLVRKAKDDIVQFNVSNLSNDIYYLHIYDGINEEPDMQQIGADMRVRPKIYYITGYQLLFIFNFVLYFSLILCKE